MADRRRYGRQNAMSYHNAQAQAINQMQPRGWEYLFGPSRGRQFEMSQAAREATQEQDALMAQQLADQQYLRGVAPMIDTTLAAMQDAGVSDAMQAGYQQSMQDALVNSDQGDMAQQVANVQNKATIGLKSPRYNPKLAAQQEAELYERQLDLVAKEQAIAQNAALADRNYFTPDQWAQNVEDMGQYGLIYDNLKELDTIMRADPQLIYGGTASVASFLASTLQSTSLVMMGLGVVNTEGDERMLAKVQPVIDGLKAGGKLDESKMATIQEYIRWVERKMEIKAKATKLNPLEYTGQNRTLKQINESFRLDAPKEGPGGNFTKVVQDENFDPLGLGASTDVLREMAGGFLSLMPRR